jgi:response regulator RpfG family c-di-GMP phosphodiesterase
MQPGQNAGALKILDRLRDDARITSSQYESVYHHARRSGEPILELLIETQAMSEHDVLKAVAQMYQTRFVSTERLARAGITPQTLAMVPRRVCERYQCCPIVFDPRTQSLSLVVADPEEDIPKQVQVVTGVRDVRGYVARPAAILASIRKYYGGDPLAFSGLLPEPGSAPVPDENTGAFAAPPDRGGITVSKGVGLALGLEVEAGAAPQRAARARPPAPPPRGIPAELERSEAPRAPAPPVRPSLENTLGTFEIAPDYTSYIETVKVLVSLLDQGRGELRGHSAHVAALSVKIADRLAMSQAEKNSLLVAAYLHDVGKTDSAYHLTALNVSRFEGHRIQAQRSFGAPTKLLEAARLADSTRAILEGIYERWDGQGFPARLESRFIPLGARILSLVETYCDLTTNPKNPYRRALTPREAVEVVRQLGGQLFDPALLDPLRLVVGSDRVTNAGMRPRVLVVEPDAQAAMALEICFQEQGYDVATARTAPEADARLRADRLDIVITEVELDGGDGFGLVAAARASERNKDAAFVFHTRLGDRTSVSRGYELGAADYLTKPTSAELVVAKCGQIFEALLRRRSGGSLSGNLRDMGLAEVMQVLGQARKSGCLRIVSQHRVGEIYFSEGSVVHAAFAQTTGEEAVYQILLLKDGDFKLDPTLKPKARTMQATVESLLLEGMRRMDEAGL